MASRHSENLSLIDALGDRARIGDWSGVTELITRIRDNPPPEGADEVAEYLAHLNAALVATRVSRVHMNASIARLNAAAGFHNSSSTPISRQNFNA